MRIDGNTPIDALYHSDDELYHAWLSKGKQAEKHKYIKREWKNGKWQYYYNDDTSTKSNNTTNKVSKLKVYVDGIKRDWKESEKRGTEKAAEEARSKGATLTDINGISSSTRTISIGNKVVSRTYRRGTIEKYVDTAKEYIKDRLGFDEKEGYDNARTEAFTAELRKAGAITNLNSAYKYNNAEMIKEANEEISKYKTELAEAEAKVKDARANFASTPLGKVSIIAEEGAEWLSNALYGNESKKTLDTATGDSDSDYIRDLQSKQSDAKSSKERKVKEATDHIDDLQNKILKARSKNDTTEESLLLEELAAYKKWAKKYLGIH